MLREILDNFEKNNKDKKIIYPDLADENLKAAIWELLAIWENPVVCGNSDELYKYKELTDRWLEYFEVPKDEDALAFGAQKLAAWEVDWMIAGNLSNTADVIRALIQNIWMSQEVKRSSSHFLLSKDDHTILFADAAIQVNPNVDQIAEIWFLTIQNALKYGIDPHVALLSFSTAWSGWDDPSVLKMRDATTLLRDLLQKAGLEDIPVEWEIQFDAAFIPEIWKKKNPELRLTRSANVFIFPDLSSANIAYKVAQRLAWYEAKWPILQWFKKPWNDLSRWCWKQDIIDMHHITKNQ